MANENLFVNLLHENILSFDGYGNFFRNAYVRKNQYTERLSLLNEPRPFGALHPNGYVMLNYHRCINGRSKFFNSFAHRVMWIYFNGPIPNNLQINHKDGIKHHNAVSNLELVTPKQNVKHAMHVTGTFKSFHENHWNAKLELLDVLLILKLYNIGFRICDIAKVYTIVSFSHISRIIHGTRWKF